VVPPVTIERTWYCDAEGCDAHVRGVARRAPSGFLTVTGDRMGLHHFCGWDCAMKFAAAQEPMTVIPFHDAD
jgi:hypothetical protein